MSIILAPSLLSADFSKLGEALVQIESSKAEWIHLDVMDGHFVPNITFGMPVIKSLRSHSKKIFDVHLMITQPERYILDFKKAGADHLTIHQEACPHLDRTIHAIKEAGMKVGVALNPATPIQTLQHVLPYLDIVLVMGVNPGFGGQSLIPYVFEKIRDLRKWIDTQNLSTHIVIDGGVSIETLPDLIKAGVHGLVAGNAVFQADNIEHQINQLWDQAQSVLQA
jgi:ribulose-phosphate 3-epimerase